MPTDQAGAELRVLVSIVTWNSADDILECLGSIHNSLNETGSFAVYVHDNASADDTVALIRKHYPSVNVFASDVNEGFAAHVYNLRRAPKSDVIAIANPDAVVTSADWSAILKFMAERPCVLGPKVFRRDGSFNERAFHSVGFPSFTEWVLGRSLLAAPLSRFRRVAPHRLRQRMDSARHRAPPHLRDELLEVARVSGCFFLLSGGVFETHGLFDPAMFLYAEDIEYLMRLNGAGVPCFYGGNMLTVVHRGGGSSRKRRRLHLQHNLSYTYIYRKHYGILYAFAMHFLLLVDGTLRALLLRYRPDSGLLFKYDSEASARDSTAYWLARLCHPFEAVSAIDPEPGDSLLRSTV